jgi:hypothetical protein
MVTNQYLSYQTNVQLQVLLLITLIQNFKYEFQVAYDVVSVTS